MITAKPLVVLLLSAKWAPCVPYVQLLCISGLLYPLQLVNLNVLTALGRSDLFFRLEVIEVANRGNDRLHGLVRRDRAGQRLGDLGLHRLLHQ